jgi:hypothetical protein
MTTPKKRNAFVTNLPEPRPTLNPKFDPAPLRLKRLLDALTEDIATLPESEFVEFIEDQLLDTPKSASEFVRMFRRVFERRKAWWKKLSNLKRRPFSRTSGNSHHHLASGDRVARPLKFGYAAPPDPTTRTTSPSLTESDGLLMRRSVRDRPDLISISMPRSRPTTTGLS